MAEVQPTRNSEELVSPVGMSATEDRRQRGTRNIGYRKLQEQYATTRELAWQLIRYRMEEGITQQDLADRVGTSFSQVSRIESGRYMPSGTTLLKLAAAMDKDLQIVFAQRADTTPEGSQGEERPPRRQKRSLEKHE